MEHEELIRRKVVLHGLRQREMAGALGHSRKTLVKSRALSGSGPTGVRGACPCEIAAQMDAS